MKLRCWMAMLLMLSLLLGYAGAEGFSSGQAYKPGLALVNGEVYCTGPEFSLGFAPIWRVSKDGLEKVRTNIGGWNGLYALDDGLLTIEPVLNIGEMLENIPPSTFSVKHFDPATGKTRRLATRSWYSKSGVCEAFAAQGKAYRDMHDGANHQLQRLDNGKWVTVAQWTGHNVWMHDSFCFIGSRHENQPEYIGLYEYATGKIYDVTAFALKYGLTDSAWDAVLEDGVLYLLNEGILMTVDLSSGRETLLDVLPKGGSRFILTDSQLILMSNEKMMAWAMDRNTWQVTGSVKMTLFPQSVLLHNGQLYVHQILNDAGVEMIDLATGESVQYPMN